MKILTENMFLAIALIIVLSLSACGLSLEEETTTPAATPGEVELKYDQGRSGGSSSSGQQGFLVRFSPSTKPLYISKVKVFANIRGTTDQERKSKLEILDKGYNVLYVAEEPYSSFNSKPGWVTIEIPEITVNDDFYVAFYTNSRRDNGIYIHFDSSATNKHSEMIQDGKIIDWVWGEKPLKEKTNWMIRVVGTSGELNTTASSTLETKQTPTTTLSSTPTTTPSPISTQPLLEYVVTVNHPETHLAHVSLTISNFNESQIYLSIKPIAETTVVACPPKRSPVVMLDWN